MLIPKHRLIHPLNPVPSISGEMMARLHTRTPTMQCKNNGLKLSPKEPCHMSSRAKPRQYAPIADKMAWRRVRLCDRIKKSQSSDMNPACPWTREATRTTRSQWKRNSLLRVALPTMGATQSIKWPTKPTLTHRRIQYLRLEESKGSVHFTDEMSSTPAVWRRISQHISFMKPHELHSSAASKR